MRIATKTFSNSAAIPTEFTCDGAEMIPPFSFHEVPPDTKSLVFIMDDPDTPSGKLWTHWIVFNIQPTSTSPIGTEGKTSAGTTGYHGPCPPDREHRYYFRLYALDAVLDLAQGASRSQVDDSMRGHIIAQAEYMGRYDRKR